MKLYFEPPKVTPHENPPLLPGCLYQKKQSGQIYLAAVVPIGKLVNGFLNPVPHVYLINVVTGERYSDEGFDGGHFIDVTQVSILTVKRI